jgi:hypothetical protein
MMANTNTPPTRRVKVAGQYSNPFTIKCGVPQGCPFSPLASLVVAEALTRMILGAPDIEGITANGEEHRISQFADDTQLLLKNYEGIRRATVYIGKYQKAIGMKINATKYEGIRCGSTRAIDRPQNLRYIKWLSHGEFTKNTKILGVPYWASGEDNSFWDDLYVKIKSTIAAWSSTSQLTQHGG